MAEKEGFEPTEPHGSDALQAPAFDHSATSPLNGRYYIIACQVCQTPENEFLLKRAKNRLFILCETSKFSLSPKGKNFVRCIISDGFYKFVRRILNRRFSRLLARD